ncbi:adhesion G protein-coupled receptor F4-like [Tachyglossus aculeatus]|uniref:adhesion G protein-coupled receptor F4-like n=1 Tax=Tachyglossus aculeatus TaxID=9261 RepID=UPI0018F31A3A|nr:adhesion G protein-coupled receptor F4-like [Tachyglossus aculeatus]
MAWQAAPFCLAVFFLAAALHPQVAGALQGGSKIQRPRGKSDSPILESGKCKGFCLQGLPCNQPCDGPFHGEIGFICKSQKWQKSTETCTSLSVQSLFEESPVFAAPDRGPGHGLQISIAASQFDMDIEAAGRPASRPRGKERIESAMQGISERCPADYACIVGGVQASEATSGNIAFIVELLRNISTQSSGYVNRNQMQSYSAVANHILNRSIISNWAFIPDRNAGSVLLQSVNLFAKNLSVPEGSEVVADQPFIQIRGSRLLPNASGKTFFFSLRADPSERPFLGTVLIPQEEMRKLPASSRAVGIAFPTLGAILEASRRWDGTTQGPVNGLLLSAVLPEGLTRILLVFEKMDKSRPAPSKCVGWHSERRGWDEGICETQTDTREEVTCRCTCADPLTAFSILMSPKMLEDAGLFYITCVGLGVSIFSLVLCLLIEAAVWTQVTRTEIAYVRHVCIVNIALSLLLADGWFVASLFFNSRTWKHDWCVAVTFFSHFFYLSLFFWMLFKALLILYWILVVFRRLQKSVLMRGAFAVGYGCPLLIAAITVAATEPGKGYVRREACWLNWDNTRALLAFVVPALVIVGVNLVVVLVVAVNTRRPSIGSSKSQDVVTVVRVSKNVAILTPLLGLTWGFGVATIVDSSSLVFHIIFSLLNAFQGLFILLFGTALDQKTREALKERMSTLKGNSRTEVCCKRRIWKTT